MLVFNFSIFLLNGHTSPFKLTFVTLCVLCNFMMASLLWKNKTQKVHSNYLKQVTYFCQLKR